METTVAKDIPDWGSSMQSFGQAKSPERSEVLAFFFQGARWVLVPNGHIILGVAGFSWG